MGQIISREYCTWCCQRSSGGGKSAIRTSSNHAVSGQIRLIGNLIFTRLEWHVAISLSKLVGSSRIQNVSKVRVDIHVFTRHTIVSAPYIHSGYHAIYFFCPKDRFDNVFPQLANLHSLEITRLTGPTLECITRLSEMSRYGRGGTGSILVAVLMRINSADKYLAASPIDVIHTPH